VVTARDEGDHQAVELPDAAREALDGRELLVIGGQQRGDRTIWELDDRWYGYGCGLIVELSGATATRRMEYRSAPDTCLPSDPMLFKSATVRGDAIYACTQTEVMVVDRESFEIRRHTSLPWFNDVHHVVPTPTGSLLVAVSGLDMVAELGDDDEVLDAWHVLGAEPWSNVDPAVDYRMGMDLKPHAAHPNYLFHLGDEPWATRFELRDAISLRDPSRRVAVGRERIHDGVIHGDKVLFTTVNGGVAIVDSESLVVDDFVALESPAGPDARIGWCRGLFVDGDDLWVGFSRIRQTRFRDALGWLRSGMTTSCATRIVRYSMTDWSCQGEVDLEPLGLHAVFTIAPKAPQLRPEEIVPVHVPGGGDG
jgi:hypothetical protein